MKKFIAYNIIYIVGVFSIFHTPIHTMPDNTNSTYTAEVFYDSILQQTFNKFCMNILRMQSPTEWQSLLQKIHIKYPNMPTDAQLYKELKISYSIMQPTFYAYRLYQALKYQQKILGNQVKNIIPDTKSINGYVEIGTPCRYVDYINKHTPITGTRYAVFDQKNITDILESGTIHITRGFVPYDRMIPLNNYDPISTYKILDESVDMVTCFIGLHHIPIDKIDNFIESIKRILRPGGIFLLRDHDTYNEEIFKLAYAGHATFNAIITQSSQEEEAHEIRNFKPIAYWIKLLEQHGFVVGEERIIQDNDPTRNTLIKCIKPISQTDSFLQKLQNEPEYQRYPLQTFLTAPEWFNVDSAQSYGTFLDDAPWYDFPFLKNIEIYWYIFAQSWKQARSTNSIYEILCKNDYFWTCIVIGTFMTIEYSIKSIIGSFVSAITSGTYNQTISVVVQGLSHETIAHLSQKIIIKQQYEDITVLEIPRYKTFQNSINILANSNSHIIEIGGQRIIQVKIKSADDSMHNPCIAPIQMWAKSHNAQLAYTWRLPTEAYTYGSLITPVNQLQSLLVDAQTNNFKITYIHDF